MFVQVLALQQRSQVPACVTVTGGEVKVSRSCPTLCDPMDYTDHGILQARILGVGGHSLIQGIFPTQGLNPGLSHCRQILYKLTHKGSPRILEGIAYPFSSRSSQPRNWSRISCIAGGLFTKWAIREAPIWWIICGYGEYGEIPYPHIKMTHQKGWQY